MEKRYDPNYASYQYAEFEGVRRLSRKGRKLAREAEEFLGAKPPIKNRLASKAFDLACLYSPQCAAALTFGLSGLAFQRSSKPTTQPPAHSSHPPQPF